MTLSIAALFPWGRLGRIFEALHFTNTQAAILIADSRWTYEGWVKPFEDVGTKLFQITDDAGAVYAGDVMCGEEGIKKLTERHRKKLPQDRGRSVEIARSIFSETYVRHKAERPDIQGLSCLVGACSAQGKAELWYFGSDSDFTPIQKVGVQAIGSTKAVHRYKEMLLDIENEQFQSGINIPLEPEKWAIYLVAAMYVHIIEPKFDITVGGKIPCAIIDNRGFREVVVARTNDPTVGWTSTSPAPGELTTYLQRFEAEARSLEAAQITVQEIRN